MVVNIDRGQVGTCRLKWKPGAIGIVNFGNDFAVVPACLFEAIREQVKGFCFEMKDDVIHLIPDGGMIIENRAFFQGARRFLVIVSLKLDA